MSTNYDDSKSSWGRRHQDSNYINELQLALAKSKVADVAKKELELLERKLDLEQRTNVTAEDATAGMKQDSLQVTLAKLKVDVTKKENWSY